MLRHPLSPIPRVMAALSLGAVLLFRPRQRVTPCEGPGDVVWASDVLGSGLAGQNATGPLPGQKRPPCAPRREREVAGGCWIPHIERPPCPEGTFEGQGMCLVPVLVQRPSTSIHP